MTFLMWWTCALLAWVLIEIDLKMWAHPARVRTLLPTGPVAGSGPLRAGAAEVTWLHPPAPVVVDPVHVGATEDWSPKHAVESVETDTFTEADILAGFDKLISGLHERPAYLRDFIQESMRSHAYRMIDLPTGDYGPREAMRLEALLLAEGV